MITDMNVNPDHPIPAQAFTTFRVPVGLMEASLILIVVGLAGHTLWEAMNATGSFTHAPALVRGAVVAGIVCVAARCAWARLNQWLRYGGHGAIGPAIERIEP